SCQLLSVSPSHFSSNDTATTEIYTLSLHDALPICHASAERGPDRGRGPLGPAVAGRAPVNSQLCWGFTTLGAGELTTAHDRAHRKDGLECGLLGGHAAAPPA